MARVSVQAEARVFPNSLRVPGSLDDKLADGSPVPLLTVRCLNAMQREQQQKKRQDVVVAAA